MVAPWRTQETAPSSRETSKDDVYEFEGNVLGGGVENILMLLKDVCVCSLFVYVNLHLTYPLKYDRGRCIFIELIIKVFL